MLVGLLGRVALIPNARKSNKKYESKKQVSEGLFGCGTRGRGYQQHLRWGTVSKTNQ